MLFAKNVLTKATDCQGTLGADINDSSIGIVLTAGHGERFPTTNFPIAILTGGVYEIILIDSRTTDTLTVNASGRGYDGSTAAAHTAADPIYHWQIAKHITELQALAHASGSDNQDLSGKISHSLSTAENDVLVGGVGGTLNTFVKKTLAELKTILGLGTAAYTAAADYAVTAKGVTNGDSHDHNGGDGATIPVAGVHATLKEGSLGITIDGGGSVPTIGVKGYLEVPYTCTVKAATITADASGSAVVGIWKDTYANFPPVDADTITSATPPTLSTVQKNQDTTLTGWTTALTKGDVLGFNLDSVTTCKRITVNIRVEKA